MDPQRQWPGLKGVAKINYRRNGNEESPTDTRYYICSYQAMAESLLQATRDHWGIENSLHWSWTWPLMKTAAGVRTATPARTWQWRGIGRSTCSSRSARPKAVSRPNGKRAGWDYAYLLKVLSP